MPNFWQENVDYENCYVNFVRELIAFLVFFNFGIPYFHLIFVLDSSLAREYVEKYSEVYFESW